MFVSSAQRGPLFMIFVSLCRLVSVWVCFFLQIQLRLCVIFSVLIATFNREDRFPHSRPEDLFTTINIHLQYPFQGLLNVYIDDAV